MTASTSKHPGDELVPAPTDVTHRSMVIEAMPDEIWPWLVQMGYHRAGWYIDTRWDEAIQRHFWPRFVPEHARGEFRPPLDHIEPAFQRLAVGDRVPDGPEGSAYYIVRGLDPARALCLLSNTHLRYMTPRWLWGTRFRVSGEFSWAFLLEQAAEGRTRLTIRMRARIEPRIVRYLLAPGLQVIDFLHVRQMLLGIKRRAEARHRSVPRPGAGQGDPSAGDHRRA